MPSICLATILDGANQQVGHIEATPTPMVRPYLSTKIASSQSPSPGLFITIKCDTITIGLDGVIYFNSPDRAERVELASYLKEGSPDTLFYLEPIPDNIDLAHLTRAKYRMAAEGYTGGVSSEEFKARLESLGNE